MLPITITENPKQERCYDDCEGFGLWLYGRGWIIPPTMLKLLVNVSNFHRHRVTQEQGDAGQNALISIYDGVVENVGMLMPRNDTEDTIKR